MINAFEINRLQEPVPFNQKSGRIKINLHNVHETLLLPLWCRAKASEMNCPVLKDSQALEIIQRLDYDFSCFQSRLRNFFIIMLAARAKELEEMVLHFIHEHPRATIVNIGAGLDTTFYRVNNGLIKWYDLDVPGVIALRSSLLEQNSQINSIPKSMFDLSFLEDIAQPQDGILFLISGVLVYFTESEVQNFLGAIASRFPSSEIAFDSLTPFGVAVANNMVRKSGISGAKIKWGFADIDSMEKRKFGIKWQARFPVCCKIPLSRSFGIFSSALLWLNRTLNIYSLNHIQLSVSD